MLRHFGFQDKWIGWIGECLRTSSMSVLVNGNPTIEFSMQKGIRQGDPLAPSLFVLVVEGLTSLVIEASNSGLFRGVKVGSKGELVNILKYVDDTIFVGEASMEKVRTLKVILQGFELASGLKVNFYKSCLGAIGVGRDLNFLCIDITLQVVRSINLQRRRRKRNLFQ
uniref:Reverse transcriptase domain-containing protein n=1 Tax=Cajanus cajan TaxID=3821 RepID=A0A151UDB3_CAJCA